MEKNEASSSVDALNEDILVEDEENEDVSRDGVDNDEGYEGEDIKWSHVEENDNYHIFGKKYLLE